MLNFCHHFFVQKVIYLQSLLQNISPKLLKYLFIDIQTETKENVFKISLFSSFCIIPSIA